MTKPIDSKNIDLMVLYSQKKQLGLWNQIKSNTDLNFNSDYKLLARHSFNQPKTKWEYIVYFLLFCSILQLPTVEATLEKGENKENSDALIKNNASSVQRNYSSVSSEIRNNLGFVHQEYSTQGHLDYVVITFEKRENIKANYLSKKQEELFLKSLLTKNKQLRAVYNKAKSLVNIIKRQAPEKINRSNKKNDSRLIPIITSEEAEKSNEVKARFEKMHEMNILYLYNHEVLKYKILKEMQGKSMQLLYGLKLTTEIENEIKDEQFKIISYLLLLQGQFINHALAKMFNGGGSAEQSSFIIIEALRKKVDIELVEIKDKNDDKIIHTFPLLGRLKNSILNDPTTWGDSTVILDFWAYNGVITVPILMVQSEKYKIFSYKEWNWKSTFFSRTIPELKSDAYDEVKEIHTYCQEIIDGLFATSFNLPFASLKNLPL